MSIVEVVFALGIFAVGLYFPLMSLSTSAMFYLFKTAFLETKESSVSSLVVVLAACVASLIHIYRVKRKNPDVDRPKLRADITDYLWFGFFMVFTVRTMYNMFVDEGIIEALQILLLVLPFHYVCRAEVYNSEGRDELVRKCRGMISAFWALSIFFALVSIFVGQKNTSGQVSLGDSANILLGYSAALGVLSGVVLWFNSPNTPLAKRALYLLLTIPPFWLLFGSEKRGAILSVAIGLACIAFVISGSKTRSKGGVIFVAIVVTLGVLYGLNTTAFSRFGNFSTLDKSALGRLEYQERSMANFYENPLFGTGMGAGGAYPHNIFIESAEKGGVIALSLVVLIYIVTAAQLWKVVRRDSTTALYLIPVWCIGFTMALFSLGLTMHKFLPMATGTISAVINLFTLYGWQENRSRMSPVSVDGRDSATFPDLRSGKVAEQA